MLASGLRPGKEDNKSKVSIYLLLLTYTNYCNTVIYYVLE